MSFSRKYLGIPYGLFLILFVAALVEIIANAEIHIICSVVITRSSRITQLNRITQSNRNHIFQIHSH